MWRVKSLDAILATAEKKSLHRSLGPIQLTLLGIGAIIGTGIFVLTAAASQKAGPGMMVSFVIAGAVCAVAALCYSELASMAPVSGSAYTYTYAVMGELLAAAQRAGTARSDVGVAELKALLMVCKAPSSHGDGVAERVAAVDVGHGQLVDLVRTDPRVLVREGLNVRDLTVQDVEGEVDLVVSDLSFISLRLVMDALAGVCHPGADLLLMVKPQFEVGRAALPRTGVDPDELRHVDVTTGTDFLGVPDTWSLVGGEAGAGKGVVVGVVEAGVDVAVVEERREPVAGAPAHGQFGTPRGGVAAVGPHVAQAVVVAHGGLEVAVLVAVRGDVVDEAAAVERALQAQLAADHDLVVDDLARQRVHVDHVRASAA